MKTIKVVSIDDHYLIHEAIRSLLSDHDDIELVGEGYAGEALFALVEEHRPDVVLLDLLMPQDIGGDRESSHFLPLQMLAQLAEHYPDTGIIILYQFLNRTIALGAMKYGLKGYVLKSDNLSLALPDAIRQVSRGAVFFSQEVSNELFKPVLSPPEDILTLRQREIVLALAKAPDKPYQDIADQLGISTRTLKGHLDSAYKALDVSNRAACLVKCMELGLIPFSNDGRGLRFGQL
ncbi:MAG: response regulator transcription factor [Anaerolineales bacterium]|nr:response regulator transcription factor [Anaerolineales bacterium]